MWAEFVLAVLVLELTPGPNMAYLAALAIERGRHAGVLAVAGVAGGLAVHAAVAALGLGALVAEAPLLYEGLRWTGVAYLLWLAYEGWNGDAETSLGRTAPGDATRLFLRGFASNVFNPKSILFFVSVVPSFSGGGAGLGPRVLGFGALYVAIATAVHLAIVLLAARVSPWLTAGGRQDVVRKVLSATLVLVAVWLAWTSALN